MLKNQDPQSDPALASNVSEELQAPEFVKVRTVDITPTASFTEFIDTPPVNYDYTYVLKSNAGEIAKEDLVFTIHGESMEPTIPDRAKVLGKFIRNSQWHWAKGVVIIAFRDSLVIKRILENRLDADNYLILGSDNPAFPQTVKVQLADIRIMYHADSIVKSKIH